VEQPQEIEDQEYERTWERVHEFKWEAPLEVG
jgi:hypothetical protein